MYTHLSVLSFWYLVIFEWFMVLENISMASYVYRIAGFFEGENFHEFHKSIAICENFMFETFPTK